jgi:hypothetical protein
VLAQAKSRKGRLNSRGRRDLIMFVVVVMVVVIVSDIDSPLDSDHEGGEVSHPILFGLHRSRDIRITSSAPLDRPAGRFPGTV